MKGIIHSAAKPGSQGVGIVAPLLLQRKCACGSTPSPTDECEERGRKQLRSKTLCSGCTSQYSTINSQPSEVPPIVQEVLHSPGQPLDSTARAFMEPRFGYDFSNVRVHADSSSAHSAGALKARAYTVGNDIVFVRGEYPPNSLSGKSLLAHELAHVVQQGGTTAAIQGKLCVSGPADNSEQIADAAAHTVMNSRIPSGSAALRIREQLRMTASSSPIIQRAVKTWGGEFDTDKYDLTKDPGMDGVDIVLRFKPGANANAELIGMTQTARSREKGVPVNIGGTAADQKALKERTIPSGETGAGTRVDHLAAHANPFYATKKPSATDTLADTPTEASWGQHGWRYTDNAGKLQTQDALLKDRPQLSGTQKETSQVFEATALAVKGAQTGTFYGSVQWGWEKNAAGNVSKLPLSLISQGVPSATFGRASELWNKSKTSEGMESIDLPVVSVKVITGANAQLFTNPNAAQSVMIPGTPLPVGTRFRVLQNAQYVWVQPVLYIEIVDGPLTGQRGYILNTVASRDER